MLGVALRQAPRAVASRRAARREPPPRARARAPSTSSSIAAPFVERRHDQLRRHRSPFAVVAERELRERCRRLDPRDLFQKQAVDRAGDRRAPAAAARWRARRRPRCRARRTLRPRRARSVCCSSATCSRSAMRFRGRAACSNSCARAASCHLALDAQLDLAEATAESQSSITTPR